MIYGIFFALSAVIFYAYFRLSPLFLADKWRTAGDKNCIKMGINITSKKSRNQQKIWYTFEWGKEPNQRKAAGVYTYVNPKNAIQKNYNKEALELLENKKRNLLLRARLSVPALFQPIS